MFKKLASLFLIAFIVPVLISHPANAEISIVESGYSLIQHATRLSVPQDVLDFHPGGQYGNNLFLTEYSRNRIVSISPSGVTTPAATDIDYAVAILFGSGDFGNYLYASESFSTDGNIVRIHPDGTQSILTTGIDAPLDMVWGTGGPFGYDLYVTAANANKIVRVNASGQKTDFVTELSHPTVLAFSPGGAFGNFLYVTNSHSGEIVRISPTGIKEVFVTGLGNPVGLDFGKNTAFGDYLYVTEKEGGKITKISPNGQKTPFARGFAEPVELHFCHDGYYANDMLLVDEGSGTLYRIKNLAAPYATIQTPPADVGNTAFTLKFTLGDPNGLSNLAGYQFLYNGVDITPSVMEAILASITYMDSQMATIEIPGLVLPSGKHKIEMIVMDQSGLMGYGRVIYTVP